MNYLITYDLRNPGRDYTNLYKEIISLSNGAWRHPLESVYLIQSSLSANEIHDSLRKYLDINDIDLVIEITPNFACYLRKEDVEFLQSLP